MPGLQNILSALGLGPEKIFSTLADTVDRFVLTKEEKEQLKLHLQQEIHRNFEAMAHLDLEYLKEGYREVASARNREMTLRNTIGVWVQNLAAVVVILSFVTLLFCVLYLKLPIENKDIVNILLGSLGTIVVQIFQYWFGSSAGSARKQELLQKS
jgi:hypothetical protein